MPAKKEINLNMRTQQDFWSQSIGYFKTSASILLVLAVVLLAFVTPAVKGVLNQVFNSNMDIVWNDLLLTIDFYIFAATFLVSSVGLLINLTRNRRRNDRLSVVLVGSTVGSLVFLAIYLIGRAL